MKRSNRLVLLIGIFLAIVAFVLIFVTLNGGTGGGSGARPSAPPTTAKVVIATKNLDLGATIQPADVTYKDIPIESKPVDSYADTSLVIGQIVRSPVTEQQLITSKVLNSSGAIENLQVPPGYVAIAVQVDQVSGVGTIIKPGDFVDVISGFTGADKIPLVAAVPAPSPGTNYAPEALPYNSTTVKVLSQGLQVLGTLLPPPPAEASPAPEPSAGTTVLNGQQQIVILAAPAQDAEVIKFSQIDGNISLVLRSSKDCTVTPAEGEPWCPVVATSGITLRRLVDDRGVLPPQVVQVIQPTPYPANRRPGASASPSASPGPSGSPAASTTP